MSHSANYLHSHSALERTLKDKDIVDKSHVVVDAKFKEIFTEITDQIKPFKHGGNDYIKVPILAFVHKGGLFKNLNA